MSHKLNSGIAVIGIDIRISLRASCPLWSDSDRIDASQRTDATCQNRTHAPQQTALFDHLVSTHGACVGEWRGYAVHRLSRR